MNPKQLVELARSVLAGERVSEPISSMKKGAATHFGLQYRRKESKEELASRIVAASAKKPCVQIKICRQGSVPHILRCDLEGVVDGVCSAASMIDQAMAAFAKSYPEGPAWLHVPLAVGDIVVRRQNGHYVPENPPPGEVEVSEGSTLIIKVDELSPDASAARPPSLSTESTRRTRCRDQPAARTSGPSSTRTRATRDQTKREIRALIADFVEGNPAAVESWAAFSRYRGMRVSLMDSLDFFNDNVGSLMELVHAPAGSPRRSLVIETMEERLRSGSPGLSEGTFRLFWSYEQEKDQVSQFIVSASPEQRQALVQKDSRGYGSAMRTLLDAVHGKSALALADEGSDGGENFDLDVSMASGSEESSEDMYA